MPAELAPYLELLAANAHETWAVQRLADGWTYDVQRNDDALTHPCLLPYDELPDSEKEYDRLAVTRTVQAMILLGITISADASLAG